MVHLLKALAKRPQGTADASVRRADGRPDRVRRVPERRAAREAEVQQFPIVGVERGDPSADNLDRVPGCIRSTVTPRGRCDARFSGSAPEFAPQEVDGRGSDDGPHPPVEIVPTREPRQARRVIDDADKRLLNDVEAEGLVPARQRAGKGQSTREPGLVQRGERRVVAPGQGIEKVTVAS